MIVLVFDGGLLSHSIDILLLVVFVFKSRTWWIIIEQPDPGHFHFLGQRYFGVFTKPRRSQWLEAPSLLFCVFIMVNGTFLLFS